MPVNQVFVRWRGQMQFDAHTHPGQVMSLDSAPQFGGQEAGSRPVDLLLVALAGCAAMDVLSILQKKRQAVSELEVHASGRQADQHPRVFTHIELLYRVAGIDVDPRAVERAIELSEGGYCPAFAMLDKTAHITSRYEIQRVEPSP
jgi:putative redox protein